MGQLLKWSQKSVFALVITAGLILVPQYVAAQQKQESVKPSALKAVSKVVAENEKVRVLENRFKPGAVNEAPPAPYMRVVRVLKGGTLQRTYADGKIEKVEYKTGQTVINMPSPQPYTGKNIGKGELVLYVVVLK